MTQPHRLEARCMWDTRAPLRVSLSRWGEHPSQHGTNPCSWATQARFTVRTQTPWCSPLPPTRRQAMGDPLGVDLIMMTHAADAVLQACAEVAGRGDEVVAAEALVGPESPACLRGFS